MQEGYRGVCSLASEDDKAKDATACHVAMSGVTPIASQIDV